MTNLDLSEFIQERGIRNYTGLLVIAEEQRTAGQMVIAEFVFKRNEKILCEFVTKTWQVESAKGKLEASKVSRIDTVKTHLTFDCVEGYSDQWLQCSKKVLLLNGIDTFQFATSIKDLLIHTRGKSRNLIITGPTNCTEAFMLGPLKLICSESIFENPANGKYAWIGSEKSKVVLLNYFRWFKNLIPWHNMLLLLEGETVNLPAPKDSYSEDIVISTNVAIFAINASETEMMAARWTSYEFRLQFSPQEQKHLPPCRRCFSKLVLFD